MLNNKDSALHIVVCPDNNYAMPTGVLMLSILDNNRDVHVTFHVMTSDFSDANRALFSEMLSPYDASIFFYDVDSQKLPFIVGAENQRNLSISTYLRLLMPLYLPADIERIVYLDGDIIVTRSLKPLMEWPMDNKSLLAAPDENLHNGKVSAYNQLRYLPQKGYFNAGVLVVNLARWREKGVTESMLDYAMAHKAPFVNHDQDILNYIFQDDKDELPLTWNFQSDFFYKPEYRNISWDYDKQIDRGGQAPAIIHFNTCVKPWYKQCTHPYKGLFAKYKARSPWAAVALTSQPLSFKSRLKLSLRYLASMLGVVAPAVKECDKWAKREL